MFRPKQKIIKAQMGFRGVKISFRKSGYPRFRGELWPVVRDSRPCGRREKIGIY